MIAYKMSSSLRTNTLEKKLESFFSNAPFDVRFFVTFDKIYLRRIDRKDANLVKDYVFNMVDPFDTVSNDIARLMAELIHEGWYLLLVQEISIDVKPDPLEVDDLADSEDIEDAVRTASKKKIYALWTIERVNERANQLLLRRQDQPKDIYVFIATMPIYDLLEKIRNTVKNEQWDVLNKHAHQAYVVGPDKIVNTETR
jgi:hypothetical protein